MDNYKIVPFVSVGNIYFGMKIEEVKEVLGEPNNIVDDIIMGEIRITYPHFILVFIRKKLVDVRFSDELNMSECDIVLDNINVLKTEDIINRLSELPKSKPSEEFKGFINFYGLGINLAGFGRKKMQGKREVRFFSKGRKKYYELYLKA